VEPVLLLFSATAYARVEPVLLLFSATAYARNVCKHLILGRIVGAAVVNHSSKAIEIGSRLMLIANRRCVGILTSASWRYPCMRESLCETDSDNAA
jgi:hypothetical protein